MNASIVDFNGGIESKTQQTEKTENTENTARRKTSFSKE